MGAAIAASNADTVALDIRNDQTNHIVWLARMVLRVIIVPLTMQIKVGICW